jgi:RNA polymerase sigma-70 factor (ECF subfamily)
VGVETFVSSEDGTTERMPLVAVSPGFEDVYRARYLPLLKLALVLSGSHHAAEELVQDTFLAAYRQWDSVSRYEYPEAWLRRVVINKANSRLRRSYAEARARLRWSAGRSEAVAMPEATVDFWKELRSLSKRQAQALALHYLDGCSTAEIAEALGCAEATARVHLYRGRTAMAARLGRST